MTITHKEHWVFFRPQIYLYLALLLTVCSCTLANKASATPTWKDVTEISSSGTAVPADPSIGVDNPGASLTIWAQKPTSSSDGTVDRVYTQIRVGGEQPDAVTKILSDTSSDASEPQVAVNSIGYAVVAWLQSDGVNQRVEAVTWDIPSGTMSTPERISLPGADASDLQLVVDINGNAALAWVSSESTSEIQVSSLKSTASSWSTPKTVSTEGEEANRPIIALSEDKDICVAWRSADGKKWRMQTTSGSLSGEWQDNTTISSIGAYSTRGSIAKFGESGCVVIWRQIKSKTEAIQASIMDKPGSWSSAENISPASSGDRILTPALSSNGSEAIAVWAKQSTDGTSIETAHLDAEGKWGSPKTLSSEDATNTSPIIAYSSNGTAVAVWSSLSTARSGKVLEAATFDTSSGWSEPAAVTPEGEKASRPALMIDDYGNALLSWRAQSGKEWKIKNRAYDAAGPFFKNLTITPSTGSVGSPIHIDQVSFDVWSKVDSVVWDFGDGTDQVNDFAPGHVYSATGTYKITGVATDEVGNSTTVTRTIEVTDTPSDSSDNPSISLPGDFLDDTGKNGPGTTTTKTETVKSQLDILVRKKRLKFTSLHKKTAKLTPILVSCSPGPCSKAKLKATISILNRKGKVVKRIRLRTQTVPKLTSVFRRYTFKVKRSKNRRAFKLLQRYTKTKGKYRFKAKLTLKGGKDSNGQSAVSSSLRSTTKAKVKIKR